MRGYFFDRKKRRLEEDTKISPTERQAKLKDLTMDGCPVEDLGLDFTLPGYPNIELRKGGKDLNVNVDNLGQYVRLVSHWLLVEGVATQVKQIHPSTLLNIDLTSHHLFCSDGGCERGVRIRVPHGDFANVLPRRAGPNLLWVFTGQLRPVGSDFSQRGLQAGPWIHHRLQVHPDALRSHVRIQQRGTGNFKTGIFG